MVDFVNVFLSYLMLLLVIVVIAGIAIVIGISLRKKKNREVAALNTDGSGATDSH